MTKLPNMKKQELLSYLKDNGRRRRLRLLIMDQYYESREFGGWYARANEQAIQIADGRGWERLLAAASILSPRTSVRRATTAAVEWFESGGTCDRPSGIMTAMWDKLQRIVPKTGTGESDEVKTFALGWAKTAKFYSCLKDPVDYQGVVLDTWSLRGLGYGDIFASQVMKYKELYESVERLFVQVADDVEVTPSVVQAAQWKTVMEQNGRKTFPELF